ncbi:MAG TPA: hypothetical protein VKA59_21795 [Vicinamibacterales bacterium]|nr:hypothetical protein [Vicinamibacterales bacterium]
MTAKLQKFVAGLGVVATSAAMAGCGGEFVRDGQSPVRLVISQLESAGQNTLLSDVVQMATTPAPCSTTSPCASVFNDMATVELALLLRDPGNPAAPSTPSPLNQVTINRYRVKFRRADGNNVPGVDVPYDFDSALTMTVPTSGTVEAAFQVVRHSAKEEAPLRSLRFSGDVISTIAEVTFYGRDQAGNEISVTGYMGVDFGDFADDND